MFEPPALVGNWSNAGRSALNARSNSGGNANIVCTPTQGVKDAQQIEVGERAGAGVGRDVLFEHGDGLLVLSQRQEEVGLLLHVEEFFGRDRTLPARRRVLPALSVDTREGVASSSAVVAWRPGGMPSPIAAPVRRRRRPESPPRCRPGCIIVRSVLAPPGRHLRRTNTAPHHQEREQRKQQQAEQRVDDRIAIARVSCFGRVRCEGPSTARWFCALCSRRAARVCSRAWMRCVSTFGTAAGASPLSTRHWAAASARFAAILPPARWKDGSLYASHP